MARNAAEAQLPARLGRLLLLLGSSVPTVWAHGVLRVPPPRLSMTAEANNGFGKKFSVFPAPAALLNGCDSTPVGA